MKPLLKFEHKEGLNHAIDLLKDLPEDTSRADIEKLLRQQHKSIFTDMPVFVMTTQRSLSAPIRKAAGEFNIPVYYCDSPTVPVNAEPAQLNQFALSLQDGMPVNDQFKLFEDVRFAVTRLREQSNAYLVTVNLISYNPLVRVLLCCYGYQALRLEVGFAKRLFSKIQELKFVSGIGINTTLPYPTNQELDDFLADKILPQAFTDKFSRADVMALCGSNNNQ